MVKFLIFIIIMGAVIGFFYHDRVQTWVAGWQQKAEEKAPALINQGLNKASVWWEEYGAKSVDEFVARLTAQGKAKIDAWLAEKNLNQYGDKPDTAYTGGTPLFNEQTGQTIDRYVHLLQKFPELVKSLNLGQHLK
ncbi:MAG: hypothetical protein NTZ18_02665 [Candidatus Komeilibacteria bacterium]|nr:hypothetical protein [Candidatus Komeilibacteria bacterium]